MMSNTIVITISHKSHERLSKLKKYNKERKGKMDTYNDVVEMLVNDHEKKYKSGEI